MKSIEFGVTLPSFITTYPPPHIFYEALHYNLKDLDFEVIREIALKAERLGYHSLWISDHLSWERRREIIESWTILSALSSITKKIRLGTMVLCNLIRHPGLMAEMSSTLDFISKGRLELGIGACWNEIEYTKLGIEFPEPHIRLGMLREYVEIIKKLWTQERTTYRGRYYSIKDAYCEPKPVQKPHPPILIGGGGEKLTLKIVARHADMSNFDAARAPEDVKRKMAVLKRYCHTLGRDYESIKKTINLQVVIAPTHEEYLEDMNKRHLTEGGPEPFRDWLKKAEGYYLAGTPDECIEKIERYVDLGIRLFILRFGGVPETGDMELFAEKVIPKINHFHKIVC